MRFFATVSFFLLFLHPVPAQENEHRDLDPFTVNITAELFQKNPDAAKLFARANAARDEERFEEAETLYTKVLEMEPDFYHATQRLASVAHSLGRRAEAIQLSRKALQQEKTSYNLYMLLMTLYGRDMEVELNKAELDEAGGLARKIVNDPDVDGDLLPLVCYTATQLEDLNQYNSLVQYTEEARPAIIQYLSLAKQVFPAWLAGLAVLLVAGLVLSQLVIRSAQKLPTVSTGESVGSDALLRGIYRVVLWLTCSYYFLSIPLVVLGVVILGIGVLWGLGELGSIPVKLLLIVGLIVLATVWSGLKGLLSIIRQPEDEDPGQRLEPSAIQDLRGVLDEVASVIGTRPVDSVYMTPGTEMAVMERGSLLRQLRGSTERCLILGAALLEGFRLGPFKSVLAHEYGHFCNKDTAGGGFVIGVRRSLNTMALSLAESGAATWYSPAWLFLNGFLRLFLVISQGASRLQEVLADRWAAYAYGSKNFEEGLRHVIQSSIRFSIHSQNTLGEVVENHKPLSNIYRYQPKDQADESQIMGAIEQALQEQPTLYDSHPAPSDRIAWVRRLNVNARESNPNGSAWDLFAERNRIEKAMTAEVRGSVARHYGVILVGDESETPELPPEQKVSEEDKLDLKQTYAEMSLERLLDLQQEPGLKVEAQDLLAEELSRRAGAKA